MKLRSGFTLIEITISVAIILIVLLPFGKSFLSASKTNADAKDKLIATQLAQKHMEIAKQTVLPNPTTAPDSGFDITTTISDIVNDAVALQDYSKTVATSSNNYADDIDYKNSSFHGINVIGGSVVEMEIKLTEILIRRVGVSGDTSIPRTAAHDSIKIICPDVASSINPNITLNVTNFTDNNFHVVITGEASERNKINFVTIYSDQYSGKGEVIKQPMVEQTAGVAGEYVQKIKISVVKNGKEITVLEGTKKVE